MQAKNAFKQSQGNLIVADTSCGLVIIQQSSAGIPLPKGFHMRFVPHDADGWHDGSGIIMVGAYEDLEIAVTIAAVRYGVSEEEWMPASRYAIAILGNALLQDEAIDIALLLKRGPEQGE